MMIFTQTNKRYLFSLVVILVSVTGLQQHFNFNLIPLSWLTTNYYIFLYLLSLWAGFCIISREL